MDIITTPENSKQAQQMAYDAGYRWLDGRLPYTPEPARCHVIRLHPIPKWITFIGDGPIRTSIEAKHLPEFLAVPRGECQEAYCRAVIKNNETSSISAQSTTTTNGQGEL